MKEKLKKKSLFSIFKDKIDIFKWGAKEPSEEPVLLSITKHVSTNCRNDTSHNNR